MVASTAKLPIDHLTGSGTVIASAEDVGAIVRVRRKALALTQLDVAGLGNTGNRFLVDLENGKPTVQLQKALDVIALLGLEVVVRARDARTS